MPTFDTPNPIVATFDLGAGHIQITAGDRTDTVVEVRPTDESDAADVRAAEQVRVGCANGRLSVTAPRKTWRALRRRPPSVDVTVDLPAGSGLVVRGWASVRAAGRLAESTVETAAGAVHLDETGRLKVRTAAGDVSVGRAAGHAEVTTSAGRIHVGTVEGPAVVKTSAGAISLGEVTGEARLNTANGDITVERALATVVAKTAFGSIRVGAVERGSVVLETSFGEVELGVREGTAAWLDVSSAHGRVRSHLDAAAEPGPSDETVEVRARTGFGDVVVRRAAAASATGTAGG